MAETVSYRFRVNVYLSGSEQCSTDVQASSFADAVVTAFHALGVSAAPTVVVFLLDCAGQLCRVGLTGMVEDYLWVGFMLCSFAHGSLSYDSLSTRLVPFSSSVPVVAAREVR
jgi:hypothetical protein